METQQQKGIHGGESTSPQQRQAEQQIKADDGAEDLRQIGSRDGELRQQPKEYVERVRIFPSAPLGKIQTGDNAQSGAEVLQNHGHDIGHEQHPDQHIAETGATLDVRGPVARVHVAHTDEVGWPHEGNQAAQAAALFHVNPGTEAVTDGSAGGQDGQCTTAATLTPM